MELPIYTYESEEVSIKIKNKYSLRQRLIDFIVGLTHAIPA